MIDRRPLTAATFIYKTTTVAGPGTHLSFSLNLKRYPPLRRWETIGDPCGTIGNPCGALSVALVGLSVNLVGLSVNLVGLLVLRGETCRKQMAITASAAL